MTRTVIYFATIVVGQLTSLLLLPVITKFLSPAAFGEYALALATTGLIGTFASAWVRNVGMRLFFDYANLGRTRAFFWTAALLQAVVMIVCLAVGYAVIGGTSEALPLPLYVSAGVSVMAADFYALSLNTLRAGHRAMSFGIAEIVASVVRLAGTWLGLLAGFQTPAMLFVFATLSTVVARSRRHGASDACSLAHQRSNGEPLSSWSGSAFLPFRCRSGAGSSHCPTGRSWRIFWISGRSAFTRPRTVWPIARSPG
jgi:O-antigen/teichoic acid export membrane protein